MTLAYYDSIYSGLVPVKVTEIARDPHSDRLRLSARVTATRGVYKRGDMIVESPPSRIVPRSVVYYRNGIAMIARYSWEGASRVVEPKLTACW